MVTLGEQLRLVREARGLSQKALAEKAGVRRETVSRVENNAPDSKHATIEKICRALDLDSLTQKKLDSF